MGTHCRVKKLVQRATSANEGKLAMRRTSVNDISGDMSSETLPSKFCHTSRGFNSYYILYTYPYSLFTDIMSARCMVLTLPPYEDAVYRCPVSNMAAQLHLFVVTIKYRTFQLRICMSVRVTFEVAPILETLPWRRSLHQAGKRLTDEMESIQFQCVKFCDTGLSCSILHQICFE